MSEHDSQPRDMTGTPAHEKLREYYRLHPPVIRKQRINPADNIARAIQERNARRTAELNAAAERGYELFMSGMAIEDVALEVGLAPRKLRVRWVVAGKSLD
jgi:DNA-binding PucR family transcriptional regulator